MKFMASHTIPFNEKERFMETRKSPLDLILTPDEAWLALVFLETEAVWASRREQELAEKNSEQQQ